MKAYLLNRIFIWVIYLLSTTFLYAHGNLSKRIQEKTEEIEQHPKNAILYFERGFLYQQHEEFENAISDYLKSEALSYTSKLLLYRKAQVYYSISNYVLAQQSINLCLKKDDIDVKTHKLLAQIQTKLGEFQNAINHYGFFINNARDARPSDYVEYSEIFMEISNINQQKAIEIINKGLVKIGKDTFSLQLKKLEYLNASNQLNETINQYNYFILTQNRKEFWQYKKARYLYRNNKINDCKVALELAKVSISILPEKFQNTTAIKNLIQDILNLEKKIINEN